jgi:hypothetical protein
VSNALDVSTVRGDLNHYAASLRLNKRGSMRSFAQKQNQLQKPVASSLLGLSWQPLGWIIASIRSSICSAHLVTKPYNGRCREMLKKSMPD